MPLKKIVVIGPESTGKSTLCESLAGHFRTDWVAEYAREYLLTNGKAYSYDDLLSIARGQIDLEEKYTASFQNRFARRQSASSPDPVSWPVFIDTDLYVMKVWCEFVFGKCHQWIIDQIARRKYDLYLLCNTDIPWVAEELREYPDLETRERLFRIYKDIMVNQDTPWVEIRGDSPGRFSTAVSAVLDLIGQKPA